ncbi:predicted protein [Arabidopsis lyrata subsp. lyrata]|uniref:Predicted protein n=1 Tax=Arabidopsis lyrata subsp. lyrata TaxID=81972 RepID=D7LCW8_ARALL|nr:DNA ligase 1 [Arabidopsis lyrata subsp. lyrata]EFH57404.1 predicted protein [Arabidopsis lyrata subsp. lyrata]|eukprot:XP_002881145.1 DNA ligase 1 [Arabidopsis lyrata subsp. lyrata]
MEEKNTDGKRKTVPSIPANYISILQLQERWLNEKEKKRKEEEEEERRRKQEVEEEKKIEEEDLKKAEEEKRLNLSNRKHLERNKNGGEARFVEKEKPEVTAAMESCGGEDTAEGLPKKKKKNKGSRRKRYNSKKKNQDMAVVEDVVDCGCVSIPPPESVVTENVTPVKDVVRVFRKKGEKATKSKEVTDVMAMETQFENLTIKREEETKTLKAQTQTKPINRNRPRQGKDFAHQRVKMPIGAASMVWVKKERANDGIASGVKPLNA